MSGKASYPRVKAICVQSIGEIFIIGSGAQRAVRGEHSGRYLAANFGGFSLLTNAEIGFCNVKAAAWRLV